MEESRNQRERGIRVGRGIWLPGLLFLLVSILGVSPLYANQLYNGKSSDIFKENSAKIKDKKLLKGIVEEAKEIKGELTITIMLQCTEIVEPGKEPKEELGGLRFEVLKKYLQKHLKKAEVLGTGRTHRITKDDFARQGGKGGIDILFINCGDSTDVGSSERDEEAHEQSQPKERWKKKLLEEYKRVTDKHSFLCGIKYRGLEHQSTDKRRCTDYESELETEMCLVRGNLPFVREVQHRAQYEIERLEMHHKTYDEVFGIAKKIGKKDPGAGLFTYNRKMLEGDLQRAYKGMKYFKWAERILDSGLDFMPKFKESRDPECHRCSDLRAFYISYRSYAQAVGLFIAYDKRDLTLDHLIGLHNYVRRNLGLFEIDDSQLFPICIPGSVRINEWIFLGTGHVEDPYEYWQDSYQTSILPTMQEYGIPKVPLEE